MQLSELAILALRGMSRDRKAGLAKEMGVSEDTFYRWIRDNHEHMTQAGHLAIIRRELGLGDAELLENTDSPQTFAKDTAA